jgi:hypothetical protein
MPELRKLLSNNLRSVLHPLKGHPVESALREAYCRRWEEFERVFELALRSKPGTRQQAWNLEKAAQLAEEAEQLRRWIASPFGRRPLSKGEASDLVSDMLKIGYTPEEAVATFTKSQREVRGRRARKRSKAIKALELQLTNPGHWTWRELARETYECQHDKKCDCGELLRREAIHVKQFLAKMHAPLPTPVNKSPLFLHSAKK